MKTSPHYLRFDMEHRIPSPVALMRKQRHYLRPMRRGNNYLLDDFRRYYESAQRNLDELVDQGVFSEIEVDGWKRQGETNG